MCLLFSVFCVSFCLGKTVSKAVLYHFTDKFIHRYNADIYLKRSDNPDLSGEISE